MKKRKVNSYFTIKKLNCKKRDSCIKELISVLPETGLVFFSGGIVSMARRLKVDFTSGVINYGLAAMGMSSLGTMERGGSMKLTPEKLDKILSFANAIWSSEKLFSQFTPVADFDVRLVICDGEEIRDIQSYGPPMDEVKQLYNYLWELVAPIKI